MKGDELLKINRTTAGDEQKNTIFLNKAEMFHVKHQNNAGSGYASSITGHAFVQNLLKTLAEGF